MTLLHYLYRGEGGGGGGQQGIHNPCMRVYTSIFKPWKERKRKGKEGKGEKTCAHAVRPMITYSTRTPTWTTYKWLPIGVVFHTRGAEEAAPNAQQNASSHLTESPGEQPSSAPSNYKNRIL